MNLRTASVERKTKETEIKINLHLDGQGKTQIKTGVNFLDHMLESFAKHGIFDLNVEAKEVTSQHHLVEDIAIAFGQAFDKALGDRSDINRFGHAIIPMDDALVVLAVDIGGRSHVIYDVPLESEKIDDLEANLVSHFIESFAAQIKANIHVSLIYGEKDHHIVEALFKALGQALEMATRINPRKKGIPSTKEII
ncbi:MAG: imidazoleglycerol-phosphate dehydratase HisB [Euryarchaeota archaeon]|nr:imidazoleglycerol-phosphate dehydratase HisB [Euryarchaeota archaeon]